MKTVPTTSFHNENVGPERFSQFTEAAQLFRMILGREPGVVWLQSQDFSTGSPSRLHAARSTACEISLNDTQSLWLLQFFFRESRGLALPSPQTDPLLPAPWVSPCCMKTGGRGRQGKGASRIVFGMLGKSGSCEFNYRSSLSLLFF